MKLFKLLILKAFAWGYVTLIAFLVSIPVIFLDAPDWNPWITFIIAWLLSLNLVFQDPRENFFKKIIQFPASTYFPRKQRQKPRQ